MLCTGAHLTVSSWMGGGEGGRAVRQENLNALEGWGSGGQCGKITLQCGMVFYRTANGNVFFWGGEVWAQGEGRPRHPCHGLMGWPTVSDGEHQGVGGDEGWGLGGRPHSTKINQCHLVLRSGEIFFMSQKFFLGLSASRLFWAPNGSRLTARCHFTGPEKVSISRATLLPSNPPLLYLPGVAVLLSVYTNACMCHCYQV